MQAVFRPFEINEKIEKSFMKIHENFHEDMIMDSNSSDSGVTSGAVKFLINYKNILNFQKKNYMLDFSLLSKIFYIFFLNFLQKLCKIRIEKMRKFPDYEIKFK